MVRKTISAMQATAFLAVTLLLTAQSALGAGLVGRWEASDRPFHLEFTAEGTVRMSTIGPVKSGSYRLVGDMVYIDLSDGGRFKARVKITNGGNQLILTDADGSFTVFRRVG